ncbi:unnamed protein product, partial [Symbiodinium natans]
MKYGSRVWQSPEASCHLELVQLVPSFGHARSRVACAEFLAMPGAEARAANFVEPGRVHSSFGDFGHKRRFDGGVNDPDG